MKVLREKRIVNDTFPLLCCSLEVDFKLGRISSLDDDPILHWNTSATIIWSKVIWFE